MKVLFALLSLAVSLSATELRVATFNVLTGLEAPGTTSHDSVAAILSRIDADVVALQEVTSSDRNGSPSHLEQLATNLGYPHLFVPDGITLDNNLGVALLSKFPFASTHSIASPVGSKDVTRAHAAAVVDVPGTTADPTIITLHLKCCFESDDFFRRAVELERVKFFLNDQGLDGTDNVIVLGDFNLLGSPFTYNSLPPGLPVTYSLGPDISFPVAYFMNPESYFSDYPLVNPEPCQQNGMTKATLQGGSVLDYIMISQALEDRNPVLEIYNSSFEANFPGLPKSGPALDANASMNASDHFAIFGDFNLDAGPPLSAALDITTTSEEGSAAQLTVTLPEAPEAGEAITVLVSSSASDEAMPQDLTLTFTEGVTSQSTLIIPKPDRILDGDQTITLFAAAAGYQGTSVDLTITDSDTSTYEITAFNVPTVEDFTGFAGTTAPARWTVSDSNWLGLDDGSSAQKGLRSYGQETDGSVGVLTSDAVTFTGHFHNGTGSILTALKISYTAEQWRSFFEGAADSWNVDLITEAGTTSLPELSFTASNEMTSGPITDGDSTSFSTIIQDLDIAIDADFQLRFTATPGTPGMGGSDAVFLNEFHYDNSGSDTGEFLEVVVGPSFPGTINDVDVVLYNGGTGSSYGTHTLNTFSLDQTTPSGHQIYSKSIAGIQNGSPDGIAIVHNGAVLQFLSYEGPMMAMNGPANGMTSLDIGVSQNPPPSAGQGSLGLVGTGSGPEDFTWSELSGPPTQGAPNVGQTFGASTQGQGIAFDNLEVTALIESDPDGDGLPTDIENLLGTNPTLADTNDNGINDGDEDQDGDGQSNYFESVLAQTDPLSGASSFATTLSDTTLLSFPTITGRTYVVETTFDLEQWSSFQTIAGNDTNAIVDLTPVADAVRFFRVRIFLGN